MRNLLKVYNYEDTVILVIRLSKSSARPDEINFMRTCRQVKVELWTLSDRDFVLQQVKTIRKSTSGKMYLTKFLSAAQMTSVKETRSKCADLNKNAASCSNGRARYVAIDKIMKRSDNGKLERFTEALLGQHRANEKSSSSAQDHLNKVDDSSSSVKSKNGTGGAQ